MKYAFNSYDKNTGKYQESFVKVLYTHADARESERLKDILGNQKPHLNKTLRKAIEKRPSLKYKANLTGNLIDIRNYVVVKLNRQSKLEYFDNYDKKSQDSGRI